MEDDVSFARPVADIADEGGEVGGERDLNSVEATDFFSHTHTRAQRSNERARARVQRGHFLRLFFLFLFSFLLQPVSGAETTTLEETRRETVRIEYCGPHCVRRERRFV